MFMGVKQTSLLALVLMALAFTGCQKKVSYPTCKKDADCRVDATGAEINGVCYQGKCEQCAQDADCSDAKQCVNHRCLASCQTDADCGAAGHCENSFCMADCTGNEGCSGDQECVQGRCVALGGDGSGTFGQCDGVEKVHFAFDRYDIQPEDKEILNRVAECLETHPSYTVIVRGHTDDRGTPAYNMALGQKRADSVRTYLKSVRGIASKRVQTQSYGAHKPIIDESNEYAWQQNRRADFVIGKQ